MNPIIVTGMHRSGTSAVARLLGELGLGLGNNLLPAAGGNVFGHFEETAFIQFHDELIKRFFPDRAPFCEWLPMEDAQFNYPEEVRAMAKAIWKKHRDSGACAWKDPRTSLFLDLWTGTLPDAKVIVCLRHPYQVHRSLLRRGEPFLHVSYAAAIAGWNVYNGRILKALATLPKDRFVVVDVESAFQKPELLAEALARFLGIQATPKAVQAIVAEEFNFIDDLRDSLEFFEEFSPEVGATYRSLKQMDLLDPKSLPAVDSHSPIHSQDARLIEFEQKHGLRQQTSKLLARSVLVDRRRLLDLYNHAVVVSEEQSRLIEDLSQLCDSLKAKVSNLTKA